MKSEWILFTGSPGCGKTTAIQRLVDHIQETTKHQPHHVVACTCRGFMTREVRSNHNMDRNQRIGFDLVSVPDGHTYPLARVVTQANQAQQLRQPKTGKYSVDVAALERIALPALLNSCIPVSNTQPNNTTNHHDSASSTILVLDEIGKMELHSTRFRDAVQHLLQLSLSSSSIRLIGTVPTRGKVPFCDDVCQHPFVKVYQLDRNNRDEIVNNVLRKIDTEWLPAESK